MEIVTQLAVLALIGGLLILLAAGLQKLIAFIRTRTLGPSQELLLKALEPWVHTATLAGLKIALRTLNNLDVVLDGADKKAIADSVYDLLPDVIMVGPSPIPVVQVKRIVTREVFETEVMNAYNTANAFIERNEQFLTSQIDLEEATQEPAAG